MLQNYIVIFILWKSFNVPLFSANGYKDGELEDAEYGCCTRCPPSAARLLNDKQGCEGLLRVHQLKSDDFGLQNPNKQS